MNLCNYEIHLFITCKYNGDETQSAKWSAGKNAHLFTAFWFSEKSIVGFIKVHRFHKRILLLGLQE